jgi:hypothetical protein
MILINFPRGIKYVPVDNPDKKQWFRLEEEYIAEWYYKGKMYKITIPKGYEWDGATIPRFLWSILGYYPMGKMAEASLIHDWIYVNKGILEEGFTMTRLECDKLFKQHLIAIKVDDKAINRIYRTVRVAGFYYWRAA